MKLKNISVLLMTGHLICTFVAGGQDTANNYRVPRGKVKLGILTVTNKETSRMMDGSIPQLCQPLLIIKSIVCQAWQLISSKIRMPLKLSFITVPNASTAPQKASSFITSPFFSGMQPVADEEGPMTPSINLPVNRVPLLLPRWRQRGHLSILMAWESSHSRLENS